MDRKIASDMETPDILSIALNLRAHARQTSRLNPLIFMTDPERISDPVALIRDLPVDISGRMTVIYRHFGRTDRFEIAGALRQICFARDLQLLIGNDPKLAIACGADGVHFSRYTPPETVFLWKRRCPNWLLSMAGQKGPDVYEIHSPEKGTEIFDILDGLLISSVFESASPSAGTPIGVQAFTTLCQNLDVPVFALGGITAKTAPVLKHSRAAGLAVVSAIKSL